MRCGGKKAFRQQADAKAAGYELDPSLHGFDLEAYVDAGINIILEAALRGDLKVAHVVYERYKTEGASEVVAAANSFLAPLATSKLQGAWVKGPVSLIGFSRTYESLFHLIPSGMLDDCHRPVVEYLKADEELHAAKQEEYVQRANGYMRQAFAGVPTPISEVNGFVEKATELGFLSEELDALIEAISVERRWEYPGFYRVAEPEAEDCPERCITEKGSELEGGIYAYAGVLGSYY